MAEPQKPAWGSYADLKRIQRERDLAQQAAQQAPHVAPPSPTPAPVETVEPVSPTVPGPPPAEVAQPTTPVPAAEPSGHLAKPSVPVSEPTVDASTPAPAAVAQPSVDAPPPAPATVGQPTGNAPPPAPATVGQPTGNAPPPAPAAVPPPVGGGSLASSPPPTDSTASDSQTGHPDSGHPQIGHPTIEHPQFGHPQVGHPNIGHPQNEHPNSGHPQIGHQESVIPGTQESDTQSPKLRAPGHPRAGTQSPSLRVSDSKQTGHPGTRKPGTQSASNAPAQPRYTTSDAEPRESPFWPSRKFKTRLNLRFPGDLAQELEKFCQRNGLSKQDAAEIAIRRLIADDRAQNRAPSQLQTGHPQTGHHDLWVPEKPHDHDDEDDDRIIIYQQMTGNRVNARDRAAFAEVRHLHVDVIREGIRLSVERAPAPVKSFRYCLGAILEVAARSAPAAPVKRPAPVPEIPQRPVEETILLARAVIRQIRQDTPSVGAPELESALLAWAAEQGLGDAATIVDTALDAESGDE